jgi:hypothetical protein
LVNCLEVLNKGNFVVMNSFNKTNYSLAKSQSRARQVGKPTTAPGYKTSEGKTKFYDLKASRFMKARLDTSQASLRRAGYAASFGDTYKDFSGRLRDQKTGELIQKPHRKPPESGASHTHNVSSNSYRLQVPISMVSSETYDSPTSTQSRSSFSSNTEGPVEIKKSRGILSRLFSKLFG